MLMVYNSLMPLRIMEEVRFWKMREKENIAMLSELCTGIEPHFAQLLQAWADVLHKTGDAADRWIKSSLNESLAMHNLAQNQSDYNKMMRHAVKQSEDLTQHLHKLAAQSHTISNSPPIIVVVQHIIRESEYFLGVFNSVITEHSELEAIPSWRSKHHADHSWAEPITQRPVPIGGHTLPPLPYAYDALEPYIDAKTMRLHHDKHHLSYVNGLNQAEKKLEQARQNNDYSLVKHWERELAFHGAGHYLHTIFWNNMSPQGGGKAVGPIAAQINQNFGSFDKFKAHFTHAAKEVEGGGWAILVWSPRSHRLEILQAEKHQNLSQWDVVPLLVLDVWEHAYYLKYNNERDRYIDAWWNVVNWNDVNERFAKARQLKWLLF